MYPINIGGRAPLSTAGKILGNPGPPDLPRTAYVLSLRLSLHRNITRNRKLYGKT